MRQCVVDGAAHGAFGQMPTAALHAAPAGSVGLTLLRAGTGRAQLLFDTIEVLDLEQQPASVLRSALDGLVELAAVRAPSMSPG